MTTITDAFDVEEAEYIISRRYFALNLKCGCALTTDHTILDGVWWRMRSPATRPTQWFLSGLTTMTNLG